MRRMDGFPGQISYTMPHKVLETAKTNPLISNLFLTDIGYFPKAQYHLRKRDAGIPQSVLVYNVSGKGIIKAKGESFKMEADSFFIIPAGVPHEYAADKDDPWSIYWIHFTGDQSTYFDSLSMKINAIERNSSSRVNDRIEMFREIFRNLESGYSNDTVEYVNFTLPHLLASFTHVDKFRLLNETIEKDPTIKSINYMKDHVEKRLKLQDLADIAGLSPSHYSRVFATKIGYSPIDYFLQLKIQLACRLLDNSNLSITDISREVGFDDQFYFSRLFKNIMNVSPRGYRKR